MQKRKTLIAVLLGCGGLSSSLLAGEDAGHLNVFAALCRIFSLPEKFAVSFAALFVLIILLGFGLSFRAYVERALVGKDLSPGLGKHGVFEGLLAFLLNLTKEQCGHVYKSYLPLMAGLFFFIFTSNLTGLIPGFPPTTESFSANLALGAVAFLCYNYAGIKEHGLHYIKQFAGPVLLLSPLFLCLETISHMTRPLSLAFRLTANIFSDHLIVGVFSGLTPLVVPALFMFFGLLVSFIQSFVFVLLTGIYINMAISHDH